MQATPFKWPFGILGLLALMLIVYSPFQILFDAKDYGFDFL